MARSLIQTENLSTKRVEIKISFLVIDENDLEIDSERVDAVKLKIIGLLVLWWGLLAIGWVLRGWVAVGLEVLASTVIALICGEIGK